MHQSNAHQQPPLPLGHHTPPAVGRADSAPLVQQSFPATITYWANSRTRPPRGRWARPRAAVPRHPARRGRRRGRGIRAHGAGGRPLPAAAVGAGGRWPPPGGRRETGTGGREVDWGWNAKQLVCGVCELERMPMTGKTRRQIQSQGTERGARGEGRRTLLTRRPQPRPLHTPKRVFDWMAAVAPRHPRHRCRHTILRPWVDQCDAIENGQSTRAGTRTSKRRVRVVPQRVTGLRAVVVRLPARRLPHLPAWQLQPGQCQDPQHNAIWGSCPAPLQSAAPPPRFDG